MISDSRISRLRIHPIDFRHMKIHQHEVVILLYKGIQRLTTVVDDLH